MEECECWSSWCPHVYNSPAIGIATHYKSGRATLCGRVGVKYSSPDPKAVNCRVCLKALRSTTKGTSSGTRKR